MTSILSKIFKNKSSQNYYFEDFEKLNKKTKVEKIFNLISNYSESSEVRYVGGSIRKIINKEKVDDIDLATNVSPELVCEILKKNNVSFYEGEFIVGSSSSASYRVKNYNSYNSEETDYDDNEIIEIEADNILDFTESNPFGEY